MTKHYSGKQKNIWTFRRWSHWCTWHYPKIWCSRRILAYFRTRIRKREAWRRVWRSTRRPKWIQCFWLIITI
jgi:hypothetical protein